MGIDWEGYEPFDPGVRQPLHEVSKREARAAFDRLIAAKAERITSLRRLLRANGIELDDTSPYESAQVLNDWLRRHVEADAAAPGRLAPMWYAVVNDIALYLGDLMIRQHPQLHWTLFENGKKNISFQRHVVAGFTKVPNPKYNVDVDLVVATYAHRVIAGLPVEDDFFVKLLRTVDADA